MPDNLVEQQEQQNQQAQQEQHQQEGQQAESGSGGSDGAGTNNDSGSGGTPASEQQGGGNNEPKTFDQEYVSGLRNENASWRTKHHDEKAAREKAETDLQTLVQSLGKHLGFVKDETDPDKIIEQLTAERDQTASERDADRARLRDYELNAAVGTAAKKHGGDPDALLDSTRVKAKLTKLDPTADDYASQVDAVVSEAITANAKFKAGPVPPSSSTGDTSQGTGEQPDQLTREQLAKLSPSARLKAVREGRAAVLLGQK
ncbi:hypothetical protein GS504_15655 [Rhodococcus hoagii]|nr:hypothetical protein [Prescottella equi]NKS58894.1 hypothetical protein [Prescottella equi]